MTHFSNFLQGTLQCVAFLLLPALTFGVGYWLISKYLRSRKTLSLLAGAGLWGIVAFEASLIGILLDPDTIYPYKWPEILLTTGMIGSGTFIVILLVLAAVSNRGICQNK